MNFRKFKKNAKALSPVVASIILIAVTVAVSVVVAAWMGGMTIGLMGNAEQASITNDVLTNWSHHRRHSCRYRSKHRFSYSGHIISNNRWKHRNIVAAFTAEHK